MRRGLALLLCFSLLAIISSCGGGGGGGGNGDGDDSPSNDSIVGKWLTVSYAVDGCSTVCPGQTECDPGSAIDSVYCFTRIMQFNADGTFTFTDSDLDTMRAEQVSGTYTISGSTLTMTPDLITGLSVETGQIDVDTETLTVTITEPDATHIAKNDRITQNLEPISSILIPSSGATIPGNYNIVFNAKAIDPETGYLEGASLIWSSDIDGQIGTGETFTSITLSAGTHQITLTATDAEGALGSDTVTITVDATQDNTTPVAQISHPADYIIQMAGDDVVFAGSGIDREDGALTGSSLVWNSDIDGQIGTGETFTLSTLSAGTHNITLSSTDADGATGIDTLVVAVNAGPATGSLPDTGQANSHTDTFGEDSDYTINPPAYTKLDSNGNALNDSADSWSMVRDDVTGLIWEVKTDDASISILDKDNAYTWQDSQDVFITTLNNANFGGYSDWRLPTVKELCSIVHKGKNLPSINSAYFPNAMLNAYWTSTFNTYDKSFVQNVDFRFGNASSNNMSVHLYVRAVRGEQRNNNFIDNGDGTVTDTSTGLMWQQANASAMTWEAALANCETLNLVGHNDWRLPNINELKSIIDYESYNPSIDTTFFLGDLSSIYWSSTSNNLSSLARAIYFGAGGTSDYDKSESHFVRAVRTINSGGSGGSSD